MPKISAQMIGSSIAGRHLPSLQSPELRRRMHRLFRPAWLGTLRRTTPLSDHWGIDRGLPVDRYFIERFLAENRRDISGRVLEVKNNEYTKTFGANVVSSDVLDIDPANPCATIHADLAAALSVPSARFDCFVLTQTLQFIYDVRAAVSHAHRMLRYGGVLLTTVPSIIRMDRELERTDYWRFTVASCRALFGEFFEPDHFTVHAYGNVLAAIAFLSGMAAEELRPDELAAVDARFPVVICVRAVKTQTEIAMSHI
jgi:SAM-dependent methyltransferase